jgi:hypothetical protein
MHTIVHNEQASYCIRTLHCAVHSLSSYCTLWYTVTVALYLVIMYQYRLKKSSQVHVGTYLVLCNSHVVRTLTPLNSTTMYSVASSLIQLSLTKKSAAVTVVRASGPEKNSLQVQEAAQE